MEQPSTEPICDRCGKCCQAGGPGLHVQDQDLVRQGVISLGQLVTLRRGEGATDPVAGRVVALEEEMVKIRGRAGGRACILYDEWGRACRIHENRPAECRALFCKDDRALAELYGRDRINRQDLLADRPGLLARVLEHESRCSWELAARLAVQWEEDPGAEKELKDLVAQDEAYRDSLVQDLGVDPRETWFLLGRPMAEGMLAFGIGAVEEPGGIRLVRLPGGPPGPAR